MISDTLRYYITIIHYMFFQKASFQLLLASGTGSQGNASELPPARLRGMDQLSQAWIIHLFERLQSILEYVKSKFVQVCHVSSNFEFCDVFERLDGYHLHIPSHSNSLSFLQLQISQARVMATLLARSCHHTTTFFAGLHKPPPTKPETEQWHHPKKHHNPLAGYVCPLLHSLQWKGSSCLRFQLQAKETEGN